MGYYHLNMCFQFVSFKAALDNMTVVKMTELNKSMFIMIYFWNEIVDLAIGSILS